VPAAGVKVKVIFIRQSCVGFIACAAGIEASGRVSARFVPVA
jgi:hypothetical protein